MAFRIVFLILLASFEFRTSATTIEIQNALPGDCIVVDDVSLCNCRISSFASTNNENFECHPHTHDRIVTRQGYATFAIGFDKGNTIDSRTIPACVADLRWPADWFAVFWDWNSRCLVDSYGSKVIVKSQEQCCRTTSQPNKYLNPYFVDTRAQIQSPSPNPEFELASLQNPETNYNVETEGEEGEHIILERRRRKL